MQSVLAICLSPTFQRILVFREFLENEVNRSTRVMEIPSGKGINVSRVLQELGRDCTNLIQTGGKREEEFLELCRKDGLRVKAVHVNSDIRTCTTIINEKTHTSTELVEEAREVEEGDSERLLSLFYGEIGKYGAVVISGTKARGFSQSLYPKMVEECKKRGIMTVLDIKGQDLISSLEKGPTVIKPNLTELLATFLPEKVVHENEDTTEVKADVEKILRMIYSKYGAMSVITRGKYDTWTFDGKEFVSVKNRINLPVVNTIGCGDTLTAAMTHALMNGEALRDAVQFGMDCATKKASHIEQGI